MKAFLNCVPFLFCTLEGYSFKARAIGKRRFANARHAARDRYACKARATTKCTLTYARNADRNCYFLKTLAAVERTIAYPRHLIPVGRYSRYHNIGVRTAADVAAISTVAVTITASNRMIFFISVFSLLQKNFKQLPSEKCSGSRFDDKNEAFPGSARKKVHICKVSFTVSQSSKKVKVLFLYRLFSVYHRKKPLSIYAILVFILVFMSTPKMCTFLQSFSFLLPGQKQKQR